jgi:hypothetical protein
MSEIAMRGPGRPPGTKNKFRADEKIHPCKLSREAVQVARVGSSFAGVSVSEYVSRLVMEHGVRDVDRRYAESAAARGITVSTMPPAKATTSVPK